MIKNQNVLTLYIYSFNLFGTPDFPFSANTTFNDRMDHSERTRISRRTCFVWCRISQLCNLPNCRIVVQVQWLEVNLLLCWY